MELRRDGWTVCFTPMEASGREFVPKSACVERPDLARFVEGFASYWDYDTQLDGYIGGPFSGGVYCFRSDPKANP